MIDICRKFEQHWNILTNTFLNNNLLLCLEKLHSCLYRKSLHVHMYAWSINKLCCKWFTVYILQHPFSHLRNIDVVYFRAKPVRFNQIRNSIS